MPVDRHARPHVRRRWWYRYETTSLKRFDTRNIKAGLRGTLHVHGCYSDPIARALGDHFGMTGIGHEFSCLFPRVDGVPIPTEAPKYYLLRLLDALGIGDWIDDD